MVDGFATGWLGFAGLRGALGLVEGSAQPAGMKVVAQWFPRLAAYTDYTGWQHKQYLGTGEFTLEFGDYDVSLTVPADHVVAATGTLRNAQEVLSEAQREALLGQIPLGRLGKPADVAEAVLFLAGPGGAYVTGTTLHVNGGMYMN